MRRRTELLLGKDNLEKIQIILGFGILFFGLKYMSGDSAMGALKDSEAFQSFITSANNPFLGLVIGIIMCSVLQSSSAAIGVLQVRTSPAVTLFI